MINSSIKIARSMPAFDLTDEVSEVWAIQIERFMITQPKSYLDYFNPFAAERKSIQIALHNSVTCLIYERIPVDSKYIPIGVWFLMNWQNAKPEFGLLIDYRFSKQGIGTLCMKMAILTARWRRADAIRSAVFPDNVGAITINEKFGFKTVGRRNNGQILMEYEI